MNYPIDMYTAGFFEYAGIKSDFFLSGPSVANTCFDILFKMGCDPIILSVRTWRLHTEACMQVRCGNGCRRCRGSKKKGYVLAKDIYGNEVYTTRPFLAMRNWFEDILKKCGQNDNNKCHRRRTEYFVCQK